MLGPIPAAELGVTDAHDHLFLRSPALAGQDFDDVDKAVEEVASSDLETIVEVTPIGLGRNPAGMREVSERTGVHIVAATGYHRDAHYPPGHWVHSATLDKAWTGRPRAPVWSRPELRTSASRHPKSAG